MGTYSKSNFGDISGKVGNGVGGRWRGINFLRSLPTKNNRARTPAQLAVHARMALAAAQLSPIKDILNIGFHDKALSGLSGYNAAVKAFLANNILGEYPNYTVDYPGIVLSKGSLNPLHSAAMEHNAAISITWNVQINNRNSFADDVVFVVAYNETTDLYMVDDSATRQDATLTTDIGALAGDVVHVWIFCADRNSKAVSKNQYLGSINV